MTWAFKRQAFYLVVVLAVFLFFLFLFLRPYFNQAPSCIDNKQNGNEEGVDCGGICSRACASQVSDISVLWARAFRVVPGRYNAVAYIQNQNKNAAIFKIHYKFRFADKDNLYIGSREGDTFIPPSGRFAIFEPAINLGNSIPVFTTLEFTEKPIFVQVPEDKIKELQISVGDIALTGEDISPVITTIIKNNSLFNIPEVKVVAILYNASGNAINASSTYLDSLSGGVTVPLSFTWPEPFTEKVVSKEIIPMFNIFSVKFN
jgi:hypothetical protein